MASPSSSLVGGSGWRQGVGLAAGRRLAHGFGVLGMQEMTATVHVPNRPSHALMLRLAFAQDGHAELYQGERVDVIRYVLTRQRYRP